MIPTNLNWTICNETGSQRLFQKSNWTHLATSVPELSFRGLAIWGCVKSPNRHGVPIFVATVRRRLWIPRCIAHTTQTKRYIAARRGEKADGAVTKMGREDVGYSHFARQPLSFFKMWTDDQHSIRHLDAKRNQTCFLKICDAGLSGMELLTMFASIWLSVQDNPSYSYVPCIAWCMFAKICDITPRKAGPHMECHIQTSSGSLRSSTRW
jgi:hypothetical protein